MKIASRLFAALLLSTSTYAAADILPVTTFGNLPANATFGGKGIPTDQVVITTRGALTLGLAATQRYDAQTGLSNDGVATYFAAPGTSNNPAGTLPGATWNFDFYINNMMEGGLGGMNLTYQLLYEFDPAANTAANKMGSFSPVAASFRTASDTAQGSQNLAFGWMANPAYVTAPAGAFDPNVNGEYSFSLIAWSGSDVYARTDMKVQVGEAAAVPEPGVFALLGLGLSGLALARRRRQSK